MEKQKWPQSLSPNQEDFFKKLIAAGRCYLHMTPHPPAQWSDSGYSNPEQASCSGVVGQHKTDSKWFVLCFLLLVCFVCFSLRVRKNMKFYGGGELGGVVEGQEYNQNILYKIFLIKITLSDSI